MGGNVGVLCGVSNLTRRRDNLRRDVVVHCKV